MPHHSPVRQAFEQQVLAAELAARAEQTATQRAQHDQHAAAATGEGLAAFRANRARLGRHPRPAAALEAGSGVTAVTGDEEATAWPTPAIPGGGVPYS